MRRRWRSGAWLGNWLAGFDQELAVELDPKASQTLSQEIAVGDVADVSTWRSQDYKGVGLAVGGVPCPSFSVAGKQHGADDEGDLLCVGPRSG